MKDAVWNWLGITEKNYDKLLRAILGTEHCVKPGCTEIRWNNQDHLCETHRAEYNKWCEQFYIQSHENKESGSGQ